MYELYDIAAVVVGGTSMAGGQGNVLSTLIGSFIIAVIQNGMNLTGVESNRQKVVLGLVIFGQLWWTPSRGAVGLAACRPPLAKNDWRLRCMRRSRDSP
jgi:ribose/xylose/arabinose/galactoside ABC-type transport system permease subunit